MNERGTGDMNFLLTGIPAQAFAKLQDDLAAAQARVKELGWMAVSERLPPLDTPVWLYLPDGSIFQGGRFDSGEDGWMWCNCYGSAHFISANGQWDANDAELDDDYKPTHWMALPVPPPALTGAAR